MVKAKEKEMKEEKEAERQVRSLGSWNQIDNAEVDLMRTETNSSVKGQTSSKGRTRAICHVG
jgi:hypothetical protein